MRKEIVLQKIGGITVTAIITDNALVIVSEGAKFEGISLKITKSLIENLRALLDEIAANASRPSLR